jgi:class 3 adenylate cyclase
LHPVKERSVEQEPREQHVIIILADISGYTKFMVENHLSAVHGQMVITHLLESLLREVDIPLELQEIEGDAIFLFSTRSGDAAEWDAVLKQVQAKLLRFFEVFIQAAAGLAEMTACKCAVCTHADELKLKIVAHTGRAVFHSIGGRRQVSGADVILAHRLLKNSVPDSEYLLLSDTAYQEIGRGLGLEFHVGQESYENLGTVQVHVHYLTDRVEKARDDFYALEPEREKSAIREYMRAGSRSFMPAAWKELTRPTSNASPLSRVLFIVGWILYLPIFKLRYPRQVARHVEQKRALRARTEA